MKNKIEITDTKENFILNINGYVFNGEMISDYEIKRNDGKRGYKVIITFIPDALKTNINLATKIKKDEDDSPTFGKNIRLQVFLQ